MQSNVPVEIYPSANDFIVRPSNNDRSFAGPINESLTFQSYAEEINKTND